MADFRAGSANRIVDNVYEHLREQILSGEIPPGTRLTAPALAEKLGVSRSPVREAVQKLTRQRLAVERPRRGVEVVNCELSDTIRLFELREVLEGLAASLAALRASEEEIEDIRAAMEEHESLILKADTVARQKANMRFHALIRDAADNPELARSLDDLQAQIRLAMNTMKAHLTPNELSQTAEDHRHIYEGIAARDSETAEKAARLHIRRLHSRLKAIEAQA
ncbi:GntR family transcriptional regulator [Maritimibacter sp. UBA3975]|uniref:GntR family transcriptional regulator n=1 Tax=Maritimibacter sp. UBA3975 TaxID=1946833 RepID=UPI000C0AE8B3|nr:GntR family transcriptional regulator [Maritimibacter sp. UBA3975]MAM62230.1 GntR family transcriptional regulator [Maritimibacter sp.]|tara:strand:+ start:21334 stop:22002 length:669 start_codon:yes stop_codon:yes gene_type:complete